MKRTNPEKEKLVLTRISQGVAYADISEETNIPVSTIKKIKKRSKSHLARAEQQIIEYRVDEAKQILQKTYRQINYLLKQDEAGQIEIPLRELVLISKEMHKQSQVNNNQGVKLQDYQKSAQRNEEIIKAIRDNDDNSLAKIVLPN